MSNGWDNKPSPIQPPTPAPTAPGSEGHGDPNARKSEKCRKTQVIRVYDDTGKYWVDVETLVNASFSGSQWFGPDVGNQSQETILQLVNKLTQDGMCGDVMKVGMEPDKPITPTGAKPVGGGGGGKSVKVPARAAAMLDSRNNTNRMFSNKKIISSTAARV